MSRSLHAPAEPTVAALETILVDLEEAIEMMNRRPIQDGALRVPGSVGPHPSFGQISGALYEVGGEYRRVCERVSRPGPFRAPR